MRFVISVLALVMIAASASAGDIGRHDNGPAKRRGIREAREQLLATRELQYEMRRTYRNEAIDRAYERRLDDLLRKTHDLLHPRD